MRRVHARLCEDGGRISSVFKEMHELIIGMWVDVWVVDVCMCIFRWWVQR